ncbi:hypothetical protein BCU68_09260 [Vibrio sp. 10N.286.49.B3]|nr:hypothetical protein BCU68_09260 [Vibrio sp. 10N.286.49.B3]
MFYLSLSKIEGKIKVKSRSSERKWEVKSSKSEEQGKDKRGKIKGESKSKGKRQIVQGVWA